MKRIWWLHDGDHLTTGLFGTAGDEYGHKTYWVRLPHLRGPRIFRDPMCYGILVFQGRRWTPEEILRDAGGDRHAAMIVDWEYTQNRLNDNEDNS